MDWWNNEIKIEVMIKTKLWKQKWGNGIDKNH